ncbi:MAG: extracellular solute-binding protein [Eubacteriales bacterium]|nr:extracellular solute-binding protein [Eubacteriales bacterium]
MKRILATLLALVLVLGAVPALAANDTVSGKVVIYTSMYEDIVTMMSEALKTEFPNCEIEFFQGGTGNIQTKVAGEMETGALGCDMLMVAEPAYSLELMDGGWLHAYLSEARNNMRFPFDEQGYWYCVRVCSMGIAYNPEMYTKDQVPTSFEAFANNHDFAGLISMSNPLTSGTAMATVTGLVEKYGEDYFKALGAQDVMIESGSSALAKLETGECAAVMILEESVLKKREEEGSKLEWFIPDDGNVLVPSTVMTVAEDKSANKNIAACEAITDWLLSDAGQSYIVKGWMHSVLTDYAAEPYDGQATADLMANQISVDWEKCYKERDSIRTMFQENVTVD